MKKVIFGMIILNSIASFGGSIETKTKDKYIDIELDTPNNMLYITSTAKDISGDYDLKYIQKSKSDINLFGGSKLIDESSFDHEPLFAQIFLRAVNTVYIGGSNPYTSLRFTSVPL